MRTRAPSLRLCGICHKPVHNFAPQARYCAGWCQKVALSEKMHRFYVRHRERILAEAKAKRASLGAGRRNLETPLLTESVG